MAKEKSKKITLEEVLVPIEEQPYVIPENWCWVRPLSVLEIEYGKGLSMKELAGDGYPVLVLMVKLAIILSTCLKKKWHL